MTLPHHQPHQPNALDPSMRDLQSALDRELIASGVAPRAGPPAPRPAVPAAAPGPSMWGPSSPRVTSPLAVLVDLADNATALQKAMEAMLTEATGEPGPIRTRSPAKLPPGLFPAIHQLVAEIERTHSQIGQMIAHLRGRL